MINLLQSIIDTIRNLVTFIVHFIDSLIKLFTHIPTYISFLTTSINYLPTLIMPFAIASISLYVVFLMLGRNN